MKEKLRQYFKIILARNYFLWKALFFPKAIQNFLKYRSWDVFSVVFIETITACNRRCSYCPNSKFDRGLIKNTKKLETKLFYKIIDELSEIRWVGEIQPHSYGEPLLDERLPDLVKYARDKLPKAYIAIYTNGDFLSVDLYKKLVLAGASYFYITKHPGKEVVNVKEVLDYRKEHGQDNVFITYAPLKNITSRGGLVELDSPNIITRECTHTPKTIGIDYTGNVLLCCDDYFGSVKLGNIKDETLMTIWKKPYYKQLRNELRKGIFKLELCKRCMSMNLERGKP